MQKRLDYLDIAKGIGILLVIIGHCQIGNCQISMLGNIHSYLYSFHMPLFFFISGVCFSNKATFDSLVKKRFKQLILPTIWFSFITILVVDGLGLQVEWWDWSVHLPFSLWFLPVLFFAQLLSFCIIRRIHNIRIFILVLFALVLILHIAVKASVKSPYSSLAIPIATFYYLLGYKMKDIIIRSKTKFLTVACLCASNIIVVRLFGVSSELASGFSSPVFIAEVAAICGLLSVIAFSKVINEIGGGISLMLIWFGRNSLSIMLVHQLLKIVFDAYFPCWVVLGNKSYILVQLVWTVISSVIVTKIINSYCPIILGKK